MEKKCRQCGKVKILDLFYAHPQMGDGHLNICKECIKSNNKKNRNKKIEYYRNYDLDRVDNPKRVAQRREYYEKNKATNKYKETHYSSNRKYRKKNRNKVNAHQKLDYAVKIGVVKKECCVVCGESKTFGHHYDYNKPLDVIWLCDKHHKDAHKKIKRGNIPF